MANDNLQGGAALANELGRQPDETSQQHADRLLDAKRRGVSMDPPRAAFAIINEPARDKLDSASESAEYAFALSHAILDKIETLNGFHGASGLAPNLNTDHFIMLASTLCSLQLDQLTKIREDIAAAMKGWPTTWGHAL